MNLEPHSVTGLTGTLLMSVTDSGLASRRLVQSLKFKVQSWSRQKSEDGRPRVGSRKIAVSQ